MRNCLFTLKTKRLIKNVGRFSLGLSILLVACEKQPKLTASEASGTKLFRVTPAEIADLVVSFFEINAYMKTMNKDATPNARTPAVGEVSLFSDINEIVKIDTLDDLDGADLLYVVNFRSKRQLDQKGFVVMSADKRAVPVLAWSEEGPMELGAATSEPTKMWLGYAKEVVRRAKKEKEPDRQAFISWKKLEEYLARKTGRTTDCPHPNPQICSPCNPDWNTIVGPVTAPNSLWGQGFGFNNSMWARGCGDCGKAATGCAAVALGMIMRFDHKPSAGYNFSI